MSLARKKQSEELEPRDSRRAVIRSDRRELIGLSSELKFEFGSFEVVNYSATGIAILVRPGSVNFSTTETYTATHSVGGIQVGEYRLVLARMDRDSTGEWLRIAFELKSETLPIQKIQTVIRLCKVLGGFQESHEEMQKIPPAFRRITLETRLALANLEAQVEEMRVEKQHCSLQELERFEATVVPVVANYIGELFKMAYPELEASLQGVTEEDLAVCISFFREQLKELIYQSPFSHRSIVRPLGYPGDYEMMNIIYRNESVGTSLFGKCLHAYWLDHAEAKAVRNRSKYLYSVITRHIRAAAGAPIKISSIACGPCREVQMIIESAAETGLDLSQCTFHLLDQDVNALKHAHVQLWEAVNKTNSPVKLNLVNRAIRNVIARGWEERDFDLVYAAGVFDYFSDPVARMAAKMLYELLRPGGQLIIGNFNLTTPNQFGMRLALDWSLVYRSAETLEKLFGDLGGSVSIEQEPEGVNLFCIIQKPQKT
jgi:extracellular factor (EF) 3-hydroxypalmitic acid methyl ester biosynthesis protein